MGSTTKGTRNHKKHKFFVFLAIFCAFCVPFLLSQQLPIEPIHDIGQSVTGAYEGWFQNPDGTYSLLVGYFNRNQKQTLEIPVGADNKIQPGGPDRGQPTYFMPRRQWGVFTITVPKDFGDKKLTWTITANGKTTSIPMSLNPLFVVEPYKDSGIGNTPPVVKFESGGMAFTGPPRGFAKTFTVKSIDSLPLTVWATDDGKQPPEARPRQGPPAIISWSKFRGPGSVTFENARPTVDPNDGKTSTTAKFSAPGEYILREIGRASWRERVE